MDSYDRLESALNGIAPLPRGYAGKLRALFRPRFYDAGSIFIRAGERATHAGFIARGLFRYYYVDSTGKERIKTVAREDDFVMSYASLLTGDPSPYFVEALEASEVLLIDRASYLSGVERDPYWATIARKNIERLFIEKVRREASLLMEDAATRYERFVVSEPELHNRMRLRDIASFLGMSDVTLSRIRHDRS